jgi:hypothetical protein
LGTLEQLWAIEEIRQTKNRYFRFTDTKDWSGLATVFCRDVAIGDTGLSGAETLVNLIREATQGMRTVHRGFNSEVWVDSPDEARAKSAFEDLGFSPSGELVMHGYGAYDDTYRREDGAWRIASTKVHRFTLVDPGGAPPTDAA